MTTEKDPAEAVEIKKRLAKVGYPLLFFYTFEMLWSIKAIHVGEWPELWGRSTSYVQALRDLLYEARRVYAEQNNIKVTERDLRAPVRIA